MINPERIEEFLEERGLKLALNWFKHHPPYMQKKIIETFKVVFESNNPPTIENLETVKNYFEPKGSNRLEIFTNYKVTINEDSEAWESSLDKLAPFFPSPKQWCTYLKYKFEDSKSSVECQAYEQVINDLPFFNKNSNDPHPENQYALQAQVLIDLYHFRKVLINLFTTTDKHFKELPKPEDKKPANYKGELTDKCIRYLEKCKKEYPNLTIDKFFKTAYNQCDNCRKTKTGKKIKWRTLMNRIEKTRPDIYYRNISPRKK